jgi:hypothetical protein
MNWQDRVALLTWAHVGRKAMHTRMRTLMQQDFLEKHEHLYSSNGKHAETYGKPTPASPPAPPCTSLRKAATPAIVLPTRQAQHHRRSHAPRWAGRPKTASQPPDLQLWEGPEVEQHAGKPVVLQGQLLKPTAVPQLACTKQHQQWQTVLALQSGQAHSCISQMALPLLVGPHQLSRPSSCKAPPGSRA